MKVFDLYFFILLINIKNLININKYDKFCIRPKTITN